MNVYKQSGRPHTTSLFPNEYEKLYNKCTESSVLAGRPQKNGKKVLLSTFKYSEALWARLKCCFRVAQSAFRCGVHVPKKPVFASFYLL
ncbi:MAG: hypothetical protein JWO95_2871 [Verrucomicrobiales bacterium]|nr:hypothetical protein [Verrucomicrobiales bacterium]